MDIVMGVAGRGHIFFAMPLALKVNSKYQRQTQYALECRFLTNICQTLSITKKVIFKIYILAYKDALISL